MAKLDIQRARNSLHLATSDVHEYNDLHLYLQDAESAWFAYKVAVEHLGDLTERLKELDAGR